MVGMDAPPPLKPQAKPSISTPRRPEVRCRWGRPVSRFHLHNTLLVLGQLLLSLSLLGTPLLCAEEEKKECLRLIPGPSVPAVRHPPSTVTRRAISCLTWRSKLSFRVNTRPQPPQRLSSQRHCASNVSGCASDWVWCRSRSFHVVKVSAQLGRAHVYQGPLRVLQRHQSADLSFRMLLNLPYTDV